MTFGGMGACIAFTGWPTGTNLSCLYSWINVQQSQQVQMQSVEASPGKPYRARTPARVPVSNTTLVSPEDRNSECVGKGICNPCG
eukprot:2105482-Rhodomonas_salina.1